MMDLCVLFEMDGYVASMEFILYLMINHQLACTRWKKHHSIVFVYELPASKRGIRAAIDLLTAVKPGPSLPKVLAELIVSYITG